MTTILFKKEFCMKRYEHSNFKVFLFDFFSKIFGFFVKFSKFFGLI